MRRAATSKAAAAAEEFTELWKNVCSSETRQTCSRDTGGGQRGRMSGTAAAGVCQDFQSPKRRGCGGFVGLNHDNSPGDVEPTQDIFWDPTSPTHGNMGIRNTRVVEISDIVNRIAPKGTKPRATDSSVLQWFGDTAVACTPEIPEPKVKRRVSRQTSVDLLKLAKKFDENMQQDTEISEQLRTVNNNLRDCVNTSFSGDVKDQKCPPSSDQLEAELRALFDSSTQRISNPLSQGSRASACSQEVKKHPEITIIAETQQAELTVAKKSGSAAQAVAQKGACGLSANDCDDFDDDWVNDGLLDDSLVLELTQDPDLKSDAKAKATFQPSVKTNQPSVFKPTGNINSSHPPSGLHSKPSCSTIQELCPKPKTTNRSTFKLQSNPNFQAAREVSKSNFSVIQPKPQMSEQKCVTTKSVTAPPPDKITDGQRETSVAANSNKNDISDSLWDDGDEDALLYQICDTVERISSSQPLQVLGPSSCQGTEDFSVDRKTTAPVPIDRARCLNATASGKQRSSCSFVRSNSLPGTSCESVNYQGWNVLMKGANNKSHMSQSLPGSHRSLGTLNQCVDATGTARAGTVDAKTHMVTVRAPQKSESHHNTFKRNVADSAAISNKVFVTSQMTGKCSAAEIERKKQEALARRRQRMQKAVPKR